MSGRLDHAAVLWAARSGDPGSVIDLVVSAARDFGATDVVAYLVDFEQRVLEPLPDHGSHAEVPTAEDVAGTMAGRAFLTSAPVIVERDDGVRVWVPILEATDRTGVLAMTVQDADEATLEQCAAAGLLTGYLIAAHARCTDLYQLYRRRKAMSLAASMQWDLLPPLVLRAPGCGVAARLEPAYEVGGDCFDYAMNGGVLALALFDAMGHGVTAASIAALVLGGYRHSRREGRDIGLAHAAINDIVERQFVGEAFATGQLAELDVSTGMLTWTNAGHPCPLLIRNGQVVKQLEGELTLPWGLDGPDAAPINTEPLEPHDRLVFFTDGVIDAKAADGSDFGLDRLIDLVGRAEDIAPEETVRQIVQRVIEHRQADLRDDATVVMVEWAGRG